MKTPKVERTYHRNGRVYQETPFVRGKINGVVREWDRNGVIVKEVPMKDGLRHGLCKEWNDKGELLGTFEMKMGTGVSRHWFPNGRLEFEISVVNETFTGRQRQWDEKGNLTEEKFFLNNHRVAKDEYERACRLDSALPFYKDDDTQQRPVGEKSGQAKSERLIERLLATKKAEATEWLKADNRASQKTLAEFSPKKSCALVTELYKTGAVKVLAVDIDEDSKGKQNTDKLIVDMPSDAAKRNAIMKWCAGKNFPFSPEADNGQSHLAIFLG